MKRGGINRRIKEVTSVTRTFILELPSQGAPVPDRGMTRGRPESFGTCHGPRLLGTTRDLQLPFSKEEVILSPSVWEVRPDSESDVPGSPKRPTSL